MFERGANLQLYGGTNLAQEEKVTNSEAKPNLAKDEMSGHPEIDRCPDCDAPSCVCEEDETCFDCGLIVENCSCDADDDEEDDDEDEGICKFCGDDECSDNDCLNDDDEDEDDAEIECVYCGACICTLCSEAEVKYYQNHKKCHCRINAPWWDSTSKTG